MDCREPLEFAAGDTLAFTRYFQTYLPSAGWSLLYELRSDQNPTNPAIQFVSTPDVTNTIHQLNVAAAITVAWQPDPNAILVGFAVNAGLAQRNEIYNGTLNLLPNLGTGANDTDVKTFAQQMVENYESALLTLSKHIMLETNIQQVQILREKRVAIRTEWAFWTEKRSNEIAQQNVLNGRPSGQKVRGYFNIIPSGSPFVSQSPFIPNS